MTRPAAFLDRDGTLIEDKGFLDDPRGVTMLPATADALRLLREHGFATIVVSNQSGVARGYFDDDAVRAVNAEIARRLEAAGVSVDAWYWCSHYDEDCACRKPAPGMIEPSMQKRPSYPYTAPVSSTTPSSGESAIRQPPRGWAQ